MQFAGPAQTLAITEDDHSILFLVTTHRRWIDLILLGAFTLCFCGFAMQANSALGLLAGLGVLGYGLYHWSDPPTESLFVTQYELVSSKNGTTRWHLIYGITHRFGGEDAPSGLYTEGPFTGDCILELDEAQTLAVITAIYAKFPYPVLMPEPPPTPLDRFAERIPILGGTSRLTALNLSQPKDPKA